MRGPDQPVRLQPLVRARVTALGAEGAGWVESLPGLLEELAERWSLRLGRALPGGSASYLTTAVRADGSEAVLKVALPEERSGERVESLRAAGGRGQVLVLEVDHARAALLLERLGPSLDRSRLGVEEQLTALTSTLGASWRAPDRVAPDKATSLADAIRRRHAQLPDLAGTDRAGTDLVEHALACAAALAADPGDDLVLVHGDPHPGNLLRVRHPRPGAETGWCFVDPDPFVAERAYDLGVVVRDFSSTLLADPAHAAERLWSWCEQVTRPSGTDPARVWAWGFLERVSTGFYVASFGARRVAEPFLRSAELLVAQGRPGGGDGQIC